MKRSHRVRSAAGLLLLLIASGCAATPVRERADISNELRARVGQGTTPAAETSEAAFPPDVRLEDGLTEREAVAIALWNNPAFQADLAALGIARAELIEAGLLRNPVLSLLFPIGPKQLEAGIAWQVESIWQRPRRISIAQSNLASVADGLVQNGLELVLAVKLAHAELALAHEREAFARERAQLLGELDGLAEARLRAGDISGMEADDARLTAFEAALAADRSAHQVQAASARLSGLLGIAGDLEQVIEIEHGPRGSTLDDAEPLPALGTLLERAWASRPDLRAAELKIEEAGQRAGLAGSEWLSLTAIVDANEEGEDGSEIGPGLAVTLPLFDRGQGKEARAEALLMQSLHDYAAVRNRIATELRDSVAHWTEANEASRRHLQEIVHWRREAVRVTESAYASGELSYQAVLVSRTGLVESLAEQARIAADLRRARARLEHALGGELDRVPVEITRSP